MVKVCNWCDGKFETEYPSKNYCCPAHKRQAKRSRQRDRTKQAKMHTRHCAGCAEPFDTHHTQVLYCSKDCKHFYTKKRRKERALPVPPRRLATQLMEKTNGKCGICRQPIDLELRWPERSSFSIDHILPVHQGGSHQLENLQPSHLQCNMQKGTAVDYQYNREDFSGPVS